MNTVSPFDRPSKALKGESGGGAVMVDTSQFKMTRRSHALLLSEQAIEVKPAQPAPSSLQPTSGPSHAFS